MKTKSFFMYVLLLAISLSFNNCIDTPQGFLDSNSDEGDYKKAVKEGDFETAHNILDSIHDDYVEALGKACADVKKGQEIKKFKIIRKKYYAAIDYIYSHEITSILTSGDDQAADKVVFLLSEIPLDGNVDGSWAPFDSDSPYNQEDVAYKNMCIVINKLCDKALTLAINRHNKEFAKNIIEYYKSEYEFYGEEESKNFRARDEAKKKFEEAIKDGRLN